VIGRIQVTPTFAYNTSSPPNTIIYPTPVGFLADKFTFWRGGMKYLIEFETSKFITGRVRILWIPDPAYSSTISALDFGDNVGHIVDITGRTVYKFTIPYLQKERYQPVLGYREASDPTNTSWVGKNGQFIMQTIVPLTVSDSSADAAVHYVIYQSGAEDFEVARPKGLPLVDVGTNGQYLDGTSMPTLVDVDKKLAKTEEREERIRNRKDARAQSGAMEIDDDMNAITAFEKPFPSLIPSTTMVTKGFSMGESISSFTEYCRRYQWLGTSAPSGPTYLSPMTFSTGANFFNPLYRIMRSFLFYRGSYRLKLVTSAIDGDGDGLLYVQNVSDTDNYAEVNNFASQALVVEQVKYKAITEIEVPYYFPYAFYCPSYPATEMAYQPGVRFQLVPRGTATNWTIDQYISVGDDWTFGWPINPGVLAYENPTDQEEDFDLLDNNNGSKLETTLSKAKPGSFGPGRVNTSGPL
jgi:hypothetical protein